MNNRIYIIPDAIIVFVIQHSLSLLLLYLLLNINHFPNHDLVAYFLNTMTFASWHAVTFFCLHRLVVRFFKTRYWRIFSKLIRWKASMDTLLCDQCFFKFCSKTISIEFFQQFRLPLLRIVKLFSLFRKNLGRMGNISSLELDIASIKLSFLL